MFHQKALVTFLSRRLLEGNGSCGGSSHSPLGEAHFLPLKQTREASLQHLIVLISFPPRSIFSEQHSRRKRPAKVLFYTSLCCNTASGGGTKLQSTFKLKRISLQDRRILFMQVHFLQFNFYRNIATQDRCGNVNTSL